MITPQLKAHFLSMLEEARIEVERGNLEALVILGHRIDHTNTGWTATNIGSDACSLLGFAIVTIEGMIQFDIKTNATIRDGVTPVATVTKKRNLQ